MDNLDKVIQQFSIKILLCAMMRDKDKAAREIMRHQTALRVGIENRFKKLKRKRDVRLRVKNCG
jgi:hypothetical protein